MVDFVEFNCGIKFQANPSYKLDRRRHFSWTKHQLSKSFKKSTWSSIDQQIGCFFDLLLLFRRNILVAEQGFKATN